MHKKHIKSNNVLITLNQLFTNDDNNTFFFHCYNLYFNL